MLTTFAKEVMCVISGFNARRLAPKLLQHQPDNKYIWETEMSYAIISEYSREYFQPKTGWKIRKFSLGRTSEIMQKQCTGMVSPLLLTRKKTTRKMLPREILGTRKECDVLRLSRYLKIEIFETGANRRAAIVCSSSWCCCDSNSANRLLKEFNLSSVLFGKAFRLEPERDKVSDFSTQ